MFNFCGTVQSFQTIFLLHVFATGDDDSTLKTFMLELQNFVCRLRKRHRTFGRIMGNSKKQFHSKSNLDHRKKCPLYNLSKRKSYLGLNEKLEINTKNKGNSMPNKRSELINKCRKLNKHTLLWDDSKASSNYFI